MKSPLNGVALRLWWTLINVGVSIDSVAISPNPVVANATFIISVEVSLVSIESTHSNMSAYKHSELTMYTHEQLEATE